MSVLIKSALVIDEQSPYHNQTVDIFIQNGIVKEISNNLNIEASTLIDYKDICISNGWLDIFAHYCEPGFESKETISSGIASALAGGFTKVFVTPNTNPTINSKSVVQYIINQTAQYPIKIFPLGTISNQLEGKGLSEMLDMHAHGAIAFTDAWRPIQSAALMLKALEYVKAFDGVLIQVPIDETLSSWGLVHEGVISTELGMPGIPTIAETLLLHRDIELLRYTDSRLHVTGIASREAINMIRNAKKEGLNITCSVTPYHLTLNDEVLRTYNSLYKVMPPIRTEDDRQALIEGIIDGTIDCIASHHRPQDWDAKSKEFEYAADGMNVQELAFNIVYDILKDKIEISQLVKLFCDTPKRIFNIENKPLNIGVNADFTLFKLTNTTSKSKLKSLSANNPFMNQTLQGSVIGVLVNNTFVKEVQNN